MLRSARRSDQQCGEDLRTKFARRIAAGLPAVEDSARLQFGPNVVPRLYRLTHKSRKPNKIGQYEERSAKPLFVGSIPTRASIRKRLNCL